MRPRLSPICVVLCACAIVLAGAVAAAHGATAATARCGGRVMTPDIGQTKAVSAAGVASCRSQASGISLSVEVTIQIESGGAWRTYATRRKRQTVDSLEQVQVLVSRRCTPGSTARYRTVMVVKALNRTAPEAFLRSPAARRTCSTAPPPTPPPPANPPALDGLWSVSGKVVQNSDPVFQFDPGAVGTTFQRSWRFTRTCSAGTCSTTVERVFNGGSLTSPVNPTGPDAYAWQEAPQTVTGVCGNRPVPNAGVREATFTLSVTSSKAGVTGAVATGFTARGSFVFRTNVSAYAALGCTNPPTTVTYIIDYVGSPS